MADKKISELVSLAGKDVAATDLFPVVDVSVAETKSLTRDELRNAVNAIHFTATKALATTAAASLPDDTIIEVAADESLSGARTRYKVAAGALVFAYGVVTQGELDAVAARVAVFRSDSPGAESTLPCYGAISVNIVRTTIDKHAFEDWSQLNTIDTNFGYCAFDAKPTMNNGLAQNHLAGFQARCIYSGSGNLTSYLHGYDTAMVHNGTGTIAFAAGLHIRDVGGSGPITQNYGIYIDAITRGASPQYNVAIKSAEGNRHELGGATGRTYTGIALTTAVTFFSDVANKAIAYGFGTAGQENFGTHDFYNGKNGLVARISSTGLSVTGEVTTTKPLRPPVHTVASLPVGTEGAVAYCSNGRKGGEGSGTGTGVPVYYSGGVWRVFSTDSAVQA